MAETTPSSAATTVDRHVDAFDSAAERRFRHQSGECRLTLSGAIRALLAPIPIERRRRNATRRRELAEGLRTDQQLVGVAHHACGATHGVMERCDFACTSCYLGRRANTVPPLEASAVHRQLDQLREFLGPQGKAQITSGEVTLLPREVLGGYIRYARRIGLDPMVMTHGRRFLEEPEYLRRLVADDGLEKVSIHVDTTQRGRDEWREGGRESDLNPVRSRYAALVRRVRSETGKPLHAAHTVTVHAGNLGQIPEIVRWALENIDAFRMLSFQPVAEVGRTTDSRAVDLTLEGVWHRVCEGLGASLNRHAMHFGHPECHIVAPLMIVRAADRHCVLETARAGKTWDRTYLRRLLKAIGGYSIRGRSRVENVVGCASMTARHPLLLLESLLYAVYRVWSSRHELLDVCREGLRQRSLSVRPLAIVVHRFMNAEELDTPTGRERLAACTFRLPVDGGMVSMCEMNATDLRSRTYVPAAGRDATSGEPAARPSASGYASAAH